MGLCRSLSCIVVIIVAILLGLCQGFYWAFLGLSVSYSDGGLIALYVISAVVMLLICIVGILGACGVCFPIFLVMWIMGMIILIVVIVIQIILNKVLYCQGNPGQTSSIVCGTYSAVSWAALGITLGLAVIGLVFGIILFKMIKDDEDGNDNSGGRRGGKNDYDY